MKIPAKVVLICSAFMLMTSGCEREARTSMSEEQNKAIVRRFFEEVVNEANLDAADQIMTQDFVDHGLPFGLSPGLEGFKQFLSMLAGAFPDLQVSIQDILADGDKVVVRITIRGTHRGALMGIPPTNRAATWTGIDIIRMADGTMVERWGERDLIGLMEQLGVIESPM